MASRRTTGRGGSLLNVAAGVGVGDVSPLRVPIREEHLMGDSSIVVCDSVWKKFQQGERHDSLRDLIPAVTRRLLRRAKNEELGRQEFWAVKDVSFEVRRGEALR